MWGKFFKAVLTGKHTLSGWSIFAVIATVIYTISPIDAIPELFAGPIGFIDDLGLWGVLVAVFRWELGRFEKGAGAKSVTIPGTATRQTR
jgi:uncharacterized membrane protein YkvA (DUF1232 family)